MCGGICTCHRGGCPASRPCKGYISDVIFKIKRIRSDINSDSSRAELKGTQFRAENIEIGEEITGRGHAILRMKSAGDKRVCEYCVWPWSVCRAVV